MFVSLRKKMKCQKGFTLVELMLVIAIIGVLATIAVPRYSDVTITAHGSKVQADLSSIDTAIQLAITQGHAVSNANDISKNDFVKANMNSIPTPDCTSFRVGSIDYTNVGGDATYQIIVEEAVPRAAIAATASNDKKGPFTADKLGK